MPASADPRATAIAAAGEDAFGESLDRALALAPDAERVLAAEDAAAQLVAMTFVMPILAQMHESPFAAGPFAPGAGERRITPLFDQHLADRIVRNGRFPLVDAVRDHILGRGIVA